MSSKKVIAALPSFSVFSSIINLPAMNKKDLGPAIKWEAKKFIPLPIEDMILDWKIIPEAKELKPDKTKPEIKSASDLDNNQADGQSGKESLKQLGDTSRGFLANILDGKGKLTSGGKNKNIKILLTAAPKSLVQRYLQIFKAADLELISLETESFALERSLMRNDPSPAMIIDIGSISSNVNVIDHGIPILTRSIDLGGVTITKALVSNLNVDITRAEQFKRDIGFSSAGEQGDLPALIKTSISPIVNEIKYSLDIYLSQSGNGNKNKIEKIILTGGSAWLPELTSYISGILDMKVIIGDPWDHVVYPLELKPVLSEIGPRFSIAVGLAMREI